MIADCVVGTETFFSFRTALAKAETVVSSVGNFSFPSRCVHCRHLVLKDSWDSADSDNGFPDFRQDADELQQAPVTARPAGGSGGSSRREPCRRRGREPWRAGRWRKAAGAGTTPTSPWPSSDQVTLS